MDRIKRCPAGSIKADRVNLMDKKIMRDLGEQPIAKIMILHGLKSHDLVKSSTDQISYKMVARAVKGRRLTPNVQQKILKAINSATGKAFLLSDLFNYKEK